MAFITVLNESLFFPICQGSPRACFIDTMCGGCFCPNSERCQRFVLLAGLEQGDSGHRFRWSVVRLAAALLCKLGPHASLDQKTRPGCSSATGMGSARPFMPAPYLMPVCHVHWASGGVLVESAIRAASRTPWRGGGPVSEPAPGAVAAHV